MSEPANVLIVEDEHLVAADIQDLLEERGHHVLGIVTRGAEVEQKVKELDPDLILLDVVLQDDFDGIDVAERLRITSDVPIIYLTAYADQATLARAKRTKPAAYLVKPFDDREVGMSVDLALQRTRSQRRAVDQLTQTVLDAFPDPVILVDPSQCIEFINTAFLRATGLRREAVESRPLEELVPGARIEPAAEASDPMIAPHQTRRKKTEEAWRVHLLPASSGWRKPAALAIRQLSLHGELHYLVQIRHVGDCLVAEYDKQQALLELEKQTARLRILREVGLLLGAEPETAKAVSRLLEFLPAALACDGVSGLRIRLGQDDFFSCPSEPAGCSRVFPFRTPGGLSGEIEVAYAESGRPDGQNPFPPDAEIIFQTLSSLLGAHLHQTASRRALSDTRAQLEHSQKMEALGRLAGGVAHDFNNLLTVIGSYCELLLGELREREDLVAQVNQIRNATCSAAHLSRQLLAYSRRQPVSRERIDLGRFLREQREMLQRLLGKAISLKLRSLAEDLFVQADPSRLQQVLINLVVNARDASSLIPGAEIIIETANCPPAEPGQLFPGAQPIGYTSFSVVDHGSGIPHEIQEQIFEPYFTTKENGTGLGLSTCRGLIRQLDGEIVCTSLPGQGSRFTVFLPSSTGSRDKAMTLQPATLPAETGIPQTRRILIVEDDAVVRGLMAVGLEQAGFAVTVADNGRQAREILLAAAPGSIQLILTDVIMPEENGLRLAEWARRNRPQIPLIFSSAYAEDPAMAREIARYGEVIPKPFTPSELRRRISEIVSKS